MSLSHPDCPSRWLGQDYGEALAQASQLGLVPRHVVVTRPPSTGLVQGRLRVIAVRPYPNAPKAGFEYDEAFWQSLSEEGEAACQSSWTGDWEWILAYPVFERTPLERQKKK